MPLPVTVVTHQSTFSIILKMSKFFLLWIKSVILNPLAPRNCFKEVSSNSPLGVKVAFLSKTCKGLLKIVVLGEV